MEKQLRSTYYRLLAPALAALAAVAAAHLAGRPLVVHTAWKDVLGPALFIMAGSFAIGLPILYRTYFLHRHRHRPRVERSVLLTFQRRFLYMVAIPAYLAVVAYALRVSHFHLVGTVLMALYAVYYYYPSSQRLALEKRIFRMVADPAEGEAER